MIICSDIHLARHIWHRYPFIEEDSGIAFLKLAEITEPEEPVIIAGDLFDTPTIDGWQANAINKAAAIWNKKGCKVYFIQGQHDKSLIPIANAFGFIHIDKKVVKIDDIAIYGLDYRSTSVLLEELAWVPQVDLLVLHTPIKPLLGWEGSYQLDITDLPSIGLIAIGDVHVNTELRTNDGVIISPGSLVPCNVSELNKFHGCWKLGKNGLENIEIKVRDIGIVETENEIDSFIESLKNDKTLKPVVFCQELQNPILKDTYIALPYPKKDKIEQIELLKQQPAPVRKIDLFSKLNKYKKEKPQSVDLIERLLTTNNPKEELTSWLISNKASLKQ